MKLFVPLIGESVSFGEDAVPALVIEAPAAFRDLLGDLCRQAEGGKGECVLSVGNTPVSAEKYCEVLQQFFPFDLNRKTLLSKILAALEKEGLGPERFMETQELLARWETYLDTLSLSFPCRLVCDKLSLNSLLKASGVAVENDAASLPEALLQYMELVCAFDKSRLFVFVNLRAFLGTEELEAFLDAALAHKYRMLLLDAYAPARLSLEKRLTVDKDLCVF